MRPNGGQKSKQAGTMLGGMTGIPALLLAVVTAVAAGGGLVAAGLDAFTLVTLGASGLALAGFLWALEERRVSLGFRRALSQLAARGRAEARSRDAFLSAARESLVVWGREEGEPLSYGGGLGLLDGCLAGPNAPELSVALDALADAGTVFALSAQTADGRKVAVRGRPAGGYAAVFLEAQMREAAAEPDFRAMMDALPLPVWLRGRDLALKWANRAFLTATGAASVEDAVKAGVAIDRTERDLASAVHAEDKTIEAKRYAVLNGQRRALAYTLSALEGGLVAGSAIDVTATTEAEARLQQHIDAHADTLDRLATAVAIFGADKRLTFYNRAYVKLWGLPDAWLDTHPAESEVLDRLREMRRLPEQRDFPAWKRERLKLYDRVSDHPEELWHLPGGKTLRVVAQPHPFGGLIFLFEDVSDQLRLESSYNTLIKVQKATLDTLHEGVAVFSPDGRLKLFNAAFAKIWAFEPSDLESEPHLRRIVDACTARFGRGRLWDLVTAGVTSAAPERRREWGEVERSDGAIIALALAPLPDGATLASFADVTDRSRIESALRERNEALEAADQLKSEFVKHVSYELRTPLNSILGFAELLKAEVPGTLNPKQREYVDAVVKASISLKNFINDILDLSQIEAGAMELDLERLDLHELLSGVAEHARDWGAKAGLTLELECREDAGHFLADGRRLRQVIFNLLSNAFKYTPQGGTITLGGGIEGEVVRIFVSDTGPGLSPDVQATAFERFASRSHAGVRAGAGLGLALVNRFVELHGGWVALESTPGLGTTVLCNLPRNATKDATATKREGTASVEA